jgi:hypothetical protein
LKSGCNNNAKEGNMPTKPPTTAAQGRPQDRKPWKKKTPVEVVLEQADKLRQEITETEEELKLKRKQLQKFEEARKIFEAT